MLNRKTVLYILLGVLLFALFDAWQRDYAPSVDSSHAANPSRSERSADSTAALTAGTSDATKSLVAGNAASLEQRAEYLSIQTDCLDLKLNLWGGGIEEARLLQYSHSLQNPEKIKILSADAARFYVAKSDVVASTQSEQSLASSHKYLSERSVYHLAEGQNQLVVKLTGQQAGAKITKILTFQRGKYSFSVDYLIENPQNERWSGRFYSELQRKDFDNQSSLFKLSTYTGAALSSAEKPYEKVSFSDISSYVKEQQGVIRENRGGWIAMQQRYFLSAFIPDQQQNYRYFCDLQNGIYTIGLMGDEIVIPKRGNHQLHTTYYVGPEIADNLAVLARGLERTVDYGWLWMISVGLFWLLKNLQKLVGNWGLAIILITLLIKAVFYKLSESSGRSMARMKELMPKMQALKERYREDKAQLQQAMMELYKREKVNPFNLGGCLPMLIQIPFFIALYYVLISAVELRQSPLCFWIQDLSVHDPLYVLPVLMGLSMWWQQKLSPSTLEPAQAKMMMIMPIAFTFLFATFPAGLVLYWLVNNLLSILQQWHINRTLAREGSATRKQH